MKNQILELFTSINKTLNTQKQNKCSVCKQEYYKKIPYHEAAQTLYGVEKENLINWAAKRNKNQIFVLFYYAGIGTCVYAVDYEKKDWKEITDFDSW